MSLPLRFGVTMGARKCRREFSLNVVAPHNKQLQRTVERCRGRAASASFHCALAARSNRQRAAAELRR